MTALSINTQVTAQKTLLLNGGAQVNDPRVVELEKCAKLLELYEKDWVERIGNAARNVPKGDAKFLVPANNQRANDLIREWQNAFTLNPPVLDEGFTVGIDMSNSAVAKGLADLAIRTIKNNPQQGEADLKNELINVQNFVKGITYTVGYKTALGKKIPVKFGLSEVGVSGDLKDLTKSKIYFQADLSSVVHLKANRFKFEGNYKDGAWGIMFYLDFTW